VSVSFELVEGNPNPKVMSFRVHKNIMGDFAKLVVPKEGTLVESVPLARIFFENAGGVRGGDFFRVDMAHEEQGTTLVTLSRKLVPWGPGAKAGAANILKQILDNKVLCVDQEEVFKHTTPIKRLKPDNPITERVLITFNEAIRNKLEQDGGAIEPYNVTLDQETGRIDVYAWLLGSCSGCGDGGKTLSVSLEALKASFEDLRTAIPDNPSVQKLHIGQLVPQEAKNGLVITL
jgi:Fe-S cluster biogenesis protein NfuA